MSEPQVKCPICGKQATPLNFGEDDIGYAPNDILTPCDYNEFYECFEGKSGDKYLAKIKKERIVLWDAVSPKPN